MRRELLKDLRVPPIMCFPYSQMASFFFPFLTQPEDSDSCGKEEGSAQLRPRMEKGGMRTKGILIKDPGILPRVNSDHILNCTAKITLISRG